MIISMNEMLVRLWYHTVHKLYTLKIRIKCTEWDLHGSKKKIWIMIGRRRADTNEFIQISGFTEEQWSAQLTKL